jgi:hypothetical protein
MLREEIALGDLEVDGGLILKWSLDKTLSGMI